MKKILLTAMISIFSLLSCSGGLNDLYSEKSGINFENTDLASLTADTGTFSPAFDASITEYTLSVANVVESVTIAGTAAVADSTVSAPVTLTGLVAGVEQTAVLTVTAQNGAVKDYTITVTRAASDSTNADLSALTVDKGTLSPAFDPAITDYTVNLPNIETSITVTGTASDANATVSAPVTLDNLAAGVEETAVITVTAGNGFPKDYNVTVTRLIPSTIVFADGATVTKQMGSGVYTNAVTGDGTGTITYSSGTPSIATVDTWTGTVTFVAVGSTVITSTKAATATHEAVTNSYTLTITVAAPTVVNIAAINGVTPPAYGETPVPAITETDQYTGTVSWSPSGGTFGPSTLYTATITLTAKSGYTLTGVAANFFTVGGSTADTNLDSSGVITADFPATAVANITSAAVTGFLTPLTGFAKQEFGTLTAGAASYTITSLTWSPAVTTYAASTPYTGTVVLTSAAGYKFTAITPAVNTGLPSAGTVGGGDVTGNTLNFTVTYPATLPATGMSIGQSFGGGKIAYILEAVDNGYNPSVQHGIIAAIDDQSTGIIWAIVENQSIEVTGTFAEIGSGSANTDKIIARYGAGITYAAGLARAYDGGGYTDWYLPSEKELDKLCTNKVAVGGFAEYWYWSSSEQDAYNAWGVYFSSGWNMYNNKNPIFHVRAVRSF